MRRVVALSRAILLSTGNSTYIIGRRIDKRASGGERLGNPANDEELLCYTSLSGKKGLRCSPANAR